MDDPGQRLKKRREELNLRYRDVEEYSLQIASRHKNDEFGIALSRLADIENKGTVPSLYKLYSLCAIYRLDFIDALDWFGIAVANLPADAANIELSKTHPLGFQSNGHGEVQLPLALDPGIDLRKTTYLSRMIQRWGKMPLMLLNSLDLKNHRYAYVGSEDWSMYPLIQPGSLLMIDETRRKLQTNGWTNEFDRPIYFLEHRTGFLVGWCSLNEQQLIFQPHPASEVNPEVFAYPDEVDVVGQVVGIAMRLDPGRRRRIRA